MLAQDQHKLHGMTPEFKDCLRVSIFPVIGEPKILHNWLSTTSVLKIDPADNIPYARHHNPLLIRNRSWILTIHKARIFRKKVLEKTYLDFKKWAKSIQTAGYNGARTVYLSYKSVLQRIHAGLATERSQVQILSNFGWAILPDLN
jgi:hypothetical protein